MKLSFIFLFHYDDQSLGIIYLKNCSFKCRQKEEDSQNQHGTQINITIKFSQFRPFILGIFANFRYGSKLASCKVKIEGHISLYNHTNIDF